MPRRLNYTGRKPINRRDARISVRADRGKLTFDADLRLAEYGLEQITPPPRVYVEAYRGASTHWKRFDFGRLGTIQPPENRSLDEFGELEGIHFRVKVSAEGDALGKLLAVADQISPSRPDDADGHGIKLIEHVPANDIGDELWRVDFNGMLPLVKINSRVPMGVDQFLLDPQFRSLFAPAVMRQVLTRILIIDRDKGDEEDESDWRQRWLRFAARLPGLRESPDPETGDRGRLDNLEDLERYVDDAVEAFARRSGVLLQFGFSPSLEVSP